MKNSETQDEYFGSFKEKNEQMAYMREVIKSHKFDYSSKKEKEDETNSKKDKSSKKKEIELEKKPESTSVSGGKKFLQDKDLEEIKQALLEEKNEQKKKEKKQRVASLNEIQNYLLRRFSVKIRDIKFHNLQKDYLTIFLQFIIGKDVKKEVYVTPLGRQTKYIQTSSGLRFKSELLKAVEHGELRNVLVNYENEYRASYEMLNEDNLTIQVWSYNKWRVNTFMGKYSVPLSYLANDSITKAVSIKLAGHSHQKVLGRVYFTGYFQEVWDWKITFPEWKAFNVVDLDGKPLNSRLILTLRTKELREPSVYSGIVKKNANPNYEELKGSINFRGTLDELENHFVLIELRAERKYVYKLVSLRGISQTLYLKSTIKLYDAKEIKDLKSKLMSNYHGESSNKEPKPLLIDENKPSNDNNDENFNNNDDENNILNKDMDILDRRPSMNELDEAEEEDDDELLQEDKNTIYVILEGRVNLNNMPRFKQKGELIRFKKNERYLIVLVNRVESVMAPDDRNRIDSFVSVNWGGNEKFSQVFYDSNQPDFNEELIFRLPGKINKKMEKLDQLKEELNSRSEIVFNLWIENEDSSNESIGYVKFKLSELDKSSKEEKVYHEYYTGRKIKNMCRVSLFTKSFVSAIVDSPNTKIVAQICFFPDIPEKIDLRTLKYDGGDQFPKGIHEMVTKNVKDGDYTEGDLFAKWENMIRLNFARVPLEKNMQKIFMKCLFVKDQYGRQHLVSKYLGRYPIEEKLPLDIVNIEKEEKRKTIENELRLKTYGELAHFVRCIPFFEETRKSNDIWMSSDFLLTLKKGNVQDHCIFLANLFMGCQNETIKDLENNQSKKKTPDNQKNLNENRVFVCLGTIGHNKPEFHCWVMTIDRDFEKITFWETMRNEKFELPGRIKLEEKEKLKSFLYNINKEASNEGYLSKFKNITNNLKNFGSPIKKNSKSKSKNPKTPGSHDNENENDSEGEKNQFDDEENEFSFENDRKIDYKDELVEIIEDPLMEMADLPNFFQNQFKRKEPKYGFSKNSNLKPSSENQSTEPNFLDMRKKEILADESKKKDLIKLQPITFFTNEVGRKYSPVNIPYCSLEIIFNHKNAWANLQNQNPNAIYYNLHKEDEWGPLITQDGKTWNEDIGGFYETKGFSECLTIGECSKKMASIIQEIQMAISKIRSGANLETKWKHRNDKTNRHLESLLKIIENRDTRRFEENEYDEKLNTWIGEMKKLLPVNFRFSGMPLFFNYSQPEKIRSLIIENAETFYMRKEPIIYFGVTGHIFPYPNKFISVRLILAIYSKINDEVESIEEEEDFERMNQNIEEEMKKNKNGDGKDYETLHTDEKNDNLESPNNALMEEENEGEEIEL